MTAPGDGWAGKGWPEGPDEVGVSQAWWIAVERATGWSERKRVPKRNRGGTEGVSTPGEWPAEDAWLPQLQGLLPRPRTWFCVGFLQEAWDLPPLPAMQSLALP